MFQTAPSNMAHPVIHMHANLNQNSLLKAAGFFSQKMNMYLIVMLAFMQRRMESIMNLLIIICYLFQRQFMEKEKIICKKYNNYC